MLPIEVLEQAREEILNFGGSGMSVMEMSHRSKAFISIFEETKANFRRLSIFLKLTKYCFFRRRHTSICYGSHEPDTRYR